MVGSIDHGSNPSAVIGCAPEGLDHSIDAALALLARRSFPPEMPVTHEFPLEGLRDAVQTGPDRHTSLAMKVVFRPNG